MVIVIFETVIFFCMTDSVSLKIRPRLHAYAGTTVGVLRP